MPWLSFKRPSTVFQDTEFENLQLNLFCYLCTIVIVLWYCRRIQGRVQSSIVVVGSVQPPVFGLRRIGARNELGECSKCVYCLVDPVVSLMTQHHLEEMSFFFGTLVNLPLLLCPLSPQLHQWESYWCKIRQIISVMVENEREVKANCVLWNLRRPSWTKMGQLFSKPAGSWESRCKMFGDNMVDVRRRLGCRWLRSPSQNEHLKKLKC